MIYTYWEFLFTLQQLQYAIRSKFQRRNLPQRYLFITRSISIVSKPIKFVLGYVVKSLSWPKKLNLKFASKLINSIEVGQVSPGQMLPFESNNHI